MFREFIEKMSENPVPSLQNQLTWPRWSAGLNVGQLRTHDRKDKTIIDIEQCYRLENLIVRVYVLYYHCTFSWFNLKFRKPV